MKYAVFYLVIIVSLSFAGVYTVFQASQVAFHGQRVQALRAEKRALEGELAGLHQAQAQQTSLATISEIADNQGYQPLTVAATITTVTQVAAR